MATQEPTPPSAPTISNRVPWREDDRIRNNRRPQVPRASRGQSAHRLRQETASGASRASPSPAPPDSPVYSSPRDEISSCQCPTWRQPAIGRHRTKRRAAREPRCRRRSRLPPRVPGATCLAPLHPLPIAAASSHTRSAQNDRSGIRALRPDRRRLQGGRPTPTKFASFLLSTWNSLKSDLAEHQDILGYRADEHLVRNEVQAIHSLVFRKNRPKGVVRAFLTVQ